MTTLERTNIPTPADGLLVYDTSLKSFYYFNTTPSPGSWIKINAAANQRDNYKLVKSAADFPAVVSGKITLLSNTYYEINGTITLPAPLDLNNAYISGLDANEDILSFPSGTVFEGSTGGSIRNITIKGAIAFNIVGPGAATPSSLLIQNTIVDGMTTRVGNISSLGLYFGNIVQFINNTAGITYTSIGNLLLNNQAWADSNNGTFETFTGTFGLIEKVSGFSTMNGADVAINVSSNPTVGDGVILGTVFSGTTTAPSGFVNKYTTGSYTGFNFNNNWTINCPGIPRESDDVAAGNIYYNGDLANGFIQAVPNGINTPFNLNSNTTSSSNLFRADSPVNNRIRYLGKKTRTFQVNATLAIRGGTANTSGLFFAFFFRKNGTTTLVPTNTVMRINGVGTGNEIDSISISGTVELAPNEFIEIWGQRLTGVSNITNPELAIFSVNLSAK